MEENSYEDADQSADLLSDEGFSLDPSFWRWIHYLAKCSKLVYRPTPEIESALENILGMTRREVIERESFKVFVGATEDCVVVSFRGTCNLPNWIADADVFGAEPSLLGPVHPGCAKAFNCLREPLFRFIEEHLGDGAAQLWFTGHSLGGALATLAAANFARPERITGICTFGQPRTGYEEFERNFNRTFGKRFLRLVNHDDIIPRLPPRGIAYHVGRLLWFDHLGKLSENAPEEVRRSAISQPQGKPTLTEAEYQMLVNELIAAEESAAGNEATRGAAPEIEEENIGSLRGLFRWARDHAINRYIELAGALAEQPFDFPIRGLPEVQPSKLTRGAAAVRPIVVPRPMPKKMVGSLRPATRERLIEVEEPPAAAVQPDLTPLTEASTQPLWAVHVVWSKHPAVKEICGSIAAALFDYLSQKPVRLTLEEDDESKERESIPTLESKVGIPTFAGHHYKKIEELIGQLGQFHENEKRNIHIVVLLHSGADEDEEFNAFFETLMTIRAKNPALPNVRITALALDPPKRLEKYAECISDSAVGKTAEDQREEVLTEVAIDLAKFLDPAPAQLFLSYANPPSGRSLSKVLAVVQMQGPKEDVEKALGELDGVDKDRIYVSPNEEEGWYTYRLHAKEGKDLEDRIYRLSVENQWPLRQLRKREISGDAELASRIKAHCGEGSLGDYVNVCDVGSMRDFKGALKKASTRALFLCLRGDGYAGNIHCTWQMLEAKRQGVPIVTLIRLKRGEPRTSTYGGNCFTIGQRQNKDELEKIGLICLQALLHHIYFHRVAVYFKVTHGEELPYLKSATTISRPPELFDGASHGLVTTDRTSWVLHPDPPLDRSEAKSFTHVFRNVTLVTPTTIPFGDDKSPFSRVRCALSLAPSFELSTVLDGNRNWKGNPATGVLQGQFDDTLVYLIVSLLRGGASLYYGGYLSKYTSLLLQILETYGQTIEHRLNYYLPRFFPEPARAIRDKVKLLRISAKERFEPATTALERICEYSAMRQLLAEDCNARIVMGGRPYPVPWSTLRWMEAGSLEEIPKEGKAETVLAQVGPEKSIHIRIFDQTSAQSFDSSEEGLIHYAMDQELVRQHIQELKDLLITIPDLASPSVEHSRNLFRLIANVTGYEFGFRGRFPGEAEEVYQHFYGTQEPHPVFIIGGFEGTAKLISKAIEGDLGCLPTEAGWRREKVFDLTCQESDQPDPRDGMSHLERYGLPKSVDELWAKLAQTGAGYFHGEGHEAREKEVWRFKDKFVNGLTVRENRILFRSTQAFEISALISKGLVNWARLNKLASLGPLKVRLLNGSITSLTEVEEGEVRAYSVPIIGREFSGQAERAIDSVMKGEFLEYVERANFDFGCPIKASHQLVGSCVLPLQVTNSLTFTGERKAEAWEQVMADLMVDLLEKVRRHKITTLVVVPFLTKWGLGVEDSILMMVKALCNVRKEQHLPAFNQLIICEVDRASYLKIESALELLRCELATELDWDEPPPSQYVESVPPLNQVALHLTNAGEEGTGGKLSIKLVHEQASVEEKTIDFNWNDLFDYCYPYGLDRAMDRRARIAPPFEDHKEFGRYLGDTFLTREDRALIPENLPPIRILHDEACSSIPVELLVIRSPSGAGEQFAALECGVYRTLYSTDSASDLPQKEAYVRNHARNAGKLRMLLICDPTADPWLPAVVREIDALEKLLKGHEHQVEVNVLRPPHATKKAVFEELRKGVDFLHFAGHGVYDENNPGASGLRFERDEDHKNPNAILTAVDLYDARINSPPAIVFLNACEVGRLSMGNTTKVDPMPVQNRLAGAFSPYLISSGVRGFISNQWEVSDAGAELFAKSVYPDLLGGKNLGEAVLNARRSLFKDAQPDWANYVLYGSPGFTI